MSAEPAPATNVTVTGSTTNLSVSWRAPPGQVDSYTVLLSQDNQLHVSNKSLNDRTTNTVFTHLVPGVYYCVVVVSQSKTWETNSSEVCRATGELELRRDWDPVVVSCEAASVLCYYLLRKGLFFSLSQFQILLDPSLWCLRLSTPSIFHGRSHKTWTINSITSLYPALMANLSPKTAGSSWTIYSLELFTTSLLLQWECVTMRAHLWLLVATPVSLINGGGIYDRFTWI